MIDVFATARTHLAHLENGDYTAEELLDAHLAQIARHEPQLNAVVWQDEAAARQQAKAPLSGPLAGLSMTVKEAFNVAGSPTTWGIPEFANNVTQEDAVVVQRLRAAGAIVFGKTNVPKDLADLQSYNEIYGQTNNPWNTGRSPGGSSGGSGVALAAGYSAMEMGSDIGGSIRTPAHFNGVFGHKPTWALIPARGHALPGALAEPDIAVVGPMARSAYDLEMMLDVLAGADELQPGVRYELAGLNGRTLKDLKVGVWANDSFAPVSASVEARVNMVAQALADEGAQVDYDARPAFSAADNHNIYEPLLWSFMSIGTPDEEFEALQAQAANLPPSDDRPETRMLRYATLVHRDWVRLHNAREHLRWAWHEFFQRYDIVLAPQTATSAFPHDHSPMGERVLDVDGKARPYFEQIFWAGLVGISRLPSTVIPTGPDEAGLPVGVQIIGNGYSDRLTIQVAQQLEDAGFQFTAPPSMV